MALDAHRTMWPTHSSGNLRIGFAAAYADHCDEAYGYAVAVTGSARSADEVAVSAWARVWERWSAVQSSPDEQPDHAWMDRELRCAVVAAAVERTPVIEGATSRRAAVSLPFMSTTFG